MFYDGDLQSGIGKAVQEAKLVACFVTDDGGESQLWENDFLQEPNLKSSLLNQTVLLRLKAGSQEAAYLAAIFPLPKTPTFVVIKNGELKEYIATGVTKEEFLRRLGNVLGSLAPAQPPPPQASSSTASPATTNATPVDPSRVYPPAPAAPSSSSRQPTASTPASEPQPSPAVQSLLSERAARLEAQKKEKDAKEKAERMAEAQAKKEELEKAQGGPSKASADKKYALMLKKRQQDAREERARILKRVEDDKAERREREAQRKAEAKAKLESQVPPTGAIGFKQPSSTNSEECALQIRLFDGSTIRSRFPSSGSLRKDARPWIDEKQPGDVPYTFKHVLTPLSNVNIETSEEERSFRDLGLTPSATLILLPVTEYSSAYAGGGSGLLWRGVSAGYGLVSSGVGMVTGTLGSFLGGGAAPLPQQETAAPAPNPNPSINVRTLRDQRPDDQQFYNGNALNFEPRRDDEDKKDD